MTLPLFILIRAEKRQADSVVQEVNKIKGVKMAYHANGSFDVLLYAGQIIFLF
jgi:hypothetical protein